MPEITIIEPSVQMLKQQEGISGMMIAVESAARTCYKSEDKITEGSAVKMVENLCKRGHTAMLEHATVYFTWPQGIADNIKYDIIYSRFSSLNFDENNTFVTTNMRVVFEACENNLVKMLDFIRAHAVAPTDNHQKRISFRIICDRGVTHELVRHRVFSFAQESTRYVKYGEKQPFKFIKPSWWDDKIVNEQFTLEHEIFRNFCWHTAEIYEELLKLGETPQQARAVLCNAIKTEIVMTGTLQQWEAFLKLRTDKAAHPDMQIIANMIKEQLSLALSD